MNSAAAIYRPTVGKGSLPSRELAHAAVTRLIVSDPQIVDPRVRVAEWACVGEVIAVRCVEERLALTIAGSKARKDMRNYVQVHKLYFQVITLIICACYVFILLVAVLLRVFHHL
jgi:hypothetical protein